MPDRFAIAQVAPHPLEDANEVGTFAAEVSRELAARGHRVLLLAPSRSPELVRESRRLIRAAGARAGRTHCSTPTAAYACSASGSCCSPAAARASSAAPPVDIARTIEDVLSVAPLDFVHVHEPWAPSAGSRRAAPLAGAERRLLPRADRARALDAGRRGASWSCSSGGWTPAPRATTRPPSCCSATSPRPTGCCGRASAAERRPRGRRRHDAGAADRVLRPRGARRAAAVPARAAAAARGTADGRPWSSRKTGAVPDAALEPARARARGRGRVEAPRSTAPTSSWPPRWARTPLPACSSARSAPARCRSPRGCRSTRRCSHDGDLGLAVRARRRRRARRAARAARCATIALRAGLRRRGRRGAPRAVAGRAWPTRSRTIYAELAALRHDRPGAPSVRARLAKRRLIDVDLHMHTDHSNDCATPVEVLLATARERRPRRDRGDRPQRDLRRARRAREGRRVRRQGDRRRGGQDRRPGRGDRPLHRGEDPARDDARGDDRRDPPPGRARLRAAPVRPHALRPGLRAHARRGRRHRRDRGLQSRASRSPRSTRRRSASPPSTGSSAAPAATPTWPRGWARCGSACATSTAPRSSSNRCATRTSPRKPSSPALRPVQALKFLQTRATPPAARRATRRRKVARAVAGRGGQLIAGARRTRRRGEPGRRNARHRRRDPREVPRARDPRAQPRSPATSRACDRCPRGQPDAGARLGPPPGRRVAAQARADARRGRGGRRVLRPRRHRADEVAQAARHRSAGRLRHAVREVPGRRPGAGRAGVHRAAGRGDRDRRSPRSSW